MSPPCHAMIGEGVCVAEACEHPLVPRHAVALCLPASPLLAKESGGGTVDFSRCQLGWATDASQRAQDEGSLHLVHKFLVGLPAGISLCFTRMTSRMRTSASPTATSGGPSSPTHATCCFARSLAIATKVPVTAAFVSSFWCRGLPSIDGLRS